mgnify:CR=1 FL=1
MDAGREGESVAVGGVEGSALAVPTIPTGKDMARVAARPAARAECMDQTPSGDVDDKMVRHFCNDSDLVPVSSGAVVAGSSPWDGAAASESAGTVAPLTCGQVLVNCSSRGCEPWPARGRSARSCEYGRRPE